MVSISCTLSSKQFPAEHAARNRGAFFSLEQFPVRRSRPFSLVLHQAETYRKYGWKLPVKLKRALSDIESKQAVAQLRPQPFGGQASVSATRAGDGYDAEFLTLVRVGNQDIVMSLDTASSDL
jgi:hypothetical protein